MECYEQPWSRSTKTTTFFILICQFASSGAEQGDLRVRAWKYKDTQNNQNCLFKVSNINTRKRCEICSTLTIKTPKGRHWNRCSVFIVNSEHIFHLFVVCFYYFLRTSKCCLWEWLQYHMYCGGRMEIIALSAFGSILMTFQLSQKRFFE